MHYIMIVLPDNKRNDAAERLVNAAGKNICAFVLNSLIYSFAIVNFIVHQFHRNYIYLLFSFYFIIV